MANITDLTHKEIKDINKLFSNFIPDWKGQEIDDLAPDWDELIYVIEFIEGLCRGIAFQVKIEGNACEIIQNTQFAYAFDKIDLPEIYYREDGTIFVSGKKFSTMLALRDFIKWYNKKENKNNVKAAMSQLVNLKL